MLEVVQTILPVTSMLPYYAVVALAITEKVKKCSDWRNTPVRMSGNEKF